MSAETYDLGQVLDRLSKRVQELEAKSLHPPGCICPPTSEATCKAFFCPRRGFQFDKL